MNTLSVNPTTIPKILQVDMAGQPHSWLTIEEAIGYYAKEMVLFELGNPVVQYRGGFNRITNCQSVITANSIIAVKGSKVRKQYFSRTPNLTNEALFERDRYLCAYCGELFHHSDLSREHIVPVCQNGLDTWMNVVTACKHCNGAKGGRTLEQCRMSLLYLPYVPDMYENFILSRGAKKILSDQMEFLLSKVSKHSRLKLN